VSDDPQAEELSPEERARRAREASADITRLMRYGVVLAAVGMIAAAAAVALGVEGARPFAHGLAVGAIAMLLNLRLLAAASWALMADQDLLRALLGFAVSFGLLVAIAGAVAFVFPEWILGFAVGLALPAPAGIWFGLRLRDEPE
jgi:hypothetical protein